MEVTKSIFLNKTYAPEVDLVAAYAGELRTCEQLMAMGFTRSNGTKLEDRIVWLEQQVQRMKRKGGTNGE
jgi:hypothetical protein